MIALKNSSENEHCAKNAHVSRPTNKIFKGIPKDIENDPVLQELIKALPANYNFEIPKTVWKIKQLNAKTVALQMPEGLQIFAVDISRILSQYCSVTCINMADVTYGACCVDDIGAFDVEADLLIHYGHSCLVPVDRTVIPTMYVFVDIQFDTVHFLETIKTVFDMSTPLALVSIIQFVSSLQKVAVALRQIGFTDVLVPQCRPLSPGEVLGCTSPPLPESPKYTIVALGDGRFHLESIMISNPDLETFLYNPYSKVISREYYEQSKMKAVRQKSISEAAGAKMWGIIFSTLGRQGSQKVLEHMEDMLAASGKEFITLAHDQIYPELLNSMSEEVGAWVQIACPRLSIDWGQYFSKPLLTTYEAMVALRHAEWASGSSYPMDYYSRDSLGPWTPNHVSPCPCGLTSATGCKGRRCHGQKTKS